MADLKALFGKKQETNNGQTVESGNAPAVQHAAVAGPYDSGGAETQPESVPESAPQPAVKAFAFAKPAATTQPQAAEAKPKPALAGLKLPGSGAASNGPAVKSADNAGLPASDSLDDFADMDLSDIPEVSTRSQFADETPATKPTRELPAGLEKQQQQFVDLLDGMYEIVGDPELLGNVVKSMMIELKANPQYEKLLSPSDIRLVVKAARESMGIARVKKTEAKAKRGTGGSKASKLVDSDMMADLDSLGISFD